MKRDKEILDLKFKMEQLENRNIPYLKTRMDRIEETTRRIEIADYNRENARLGRIVLDTTDPRFQERKHLSTTPFPTLASSCQKPSNLIENIEIWINRKIRITPNWKLAVFFIFVMIGSLLVGNAIGYETGYKVGIANTPTLETIAGQVDMAPMTLSQFGTWFMQLELPPIGWALIILLILMVIR
jgi:hypothetical protein